MADYASDIPVDYYLYRREVIITETGGEDRADFPVKLSFTSSNFNFVLSKSNGHDIRIAEASNGTRALNMWLATWNSSLEVGTIWFKIPNLLADEVKTLYVYWGYTDARDASNISEVGFLFADGFDGISIDSSKWNTSGAHSVSASKILLATDSYIESKELPLSGVVNWIIEEGVYVDTVGASTTLACHRYRFYGTENNFGFNFFREGSTDRTHNVVNSSTYVTYNGTGKGFDASGYSENYIGYKEPTDTVYQGMSSRPSLPDYDSYWERKVYGDTRITYFRIYGRDDNTAHQLDIDWIIAREYFDLAPYSLDTSNLYVPYEIVNHEAIDWTPYGDDVTSVNFYHTTNYGGDPYKLSDNISSVITNCWYSDSDTYDGTYTYEWVLDPKYKLLLHMEDVDLIDSSLSNHYRVLNGVSRSATRYKFDNYSAYFDGTTSYSIIVETSPDWNFGTADFTIHFWVNYVDYSRPGIADYLFYWNADNYMRIKDIGVMVLEIAGVIQESTEKLDLNDFWFHIAVVKYNGTVKLYKDGVATTVSFSTGNIDVSSSLFYIGSSSGGDAMHGYIDEFIIVKGEALWTSNFTRPTEPSGPVFINTIPPVESIIDFGRGSDNLVSTENTHYDSSHSDLKNASRLSDNDDSTYFQGTTSSGYVCIKFDNNVAVGCVVVKGLTGSLDNMVKDYVFMGSYDDPRLSSSVWQIFSSGSFQRVDKEQPIYFVNGKPYKYYKLEMLNTHGGEDIILSLWQMYQYDESKRKMILSQLRLNPVAFDSQEIYFPKGVSVEVSDNMLDWIELLPLTNTVTPFYDYIWNRWQRFSFTNEIAYYNYKLVCYGNWNGHFGAVAVAEWEMVEKSTEEDIYRILDGTSNNFSSVWASVHTTFEGGFVYTGDGGFLNTVYNDTLLSSTTVSGIIDINVI